MFHDDPQVEDVTALLARAGQGRSPLGDDRRRPKVLEVHQVWGNLLVDTRHFVPDGPAVTVGPTLGHRWRLLGVDMGWVPEPLHLVLPYAPPMWSEVKSELKADFHGTCQRDLFVHEDGRWIAEVDGDRIPIEEDTRVVVEVDGLVYFAHLVHEARLVERRGASPDFPMMAIGSTAAFLGLMFALVVFFAPRPPESDLIEIPEHLVTQLSLPPPELDTEDPPGDPAPEGEKAKGEEGRAGKEDAPMKTARGKKVDVQKLELDRQVADNAGVMGFLNDDGALAGVFGTSSLSADLEGGIGGLIGAKGHQIGSGGLAGRGSGLGGGGEAEGIGGMGTHGIGDGDLAYGNGGGAKKRDGVLTTVDDSVIIGALDRAVIDEVIKNHMNQLKYCYQRELTKDGSLGGKITTKFTIARDGSVSATSIRSSTMANSAVEQCVQGTFMRMQFPAPRGGGIVIVSYPLMFTL